MAIRPVDLQGAFVGAQANSTVLRNAEEAPAIAQAAQNASFAAQASKREETIEETTHATGNKVKAKTREDESGGKQSADQHTHRRQEGNGAEEHPLGLAGEGLHFIDVTA
ncbi:MAG: hypothetical protein ABR584_00680 [Candidatus Baltobacteraceae bacterium]